MSLTVRGALRIDILQKAKLVGGKRGLDNTIRIANIMETPEVATWMKGGEFLISGGYPFKDSPELRKKIIYELAQKGVAAFAIRPGKYFDKVPGDLIEHADKLGLPLIELPPEVPYIDIMLPILECVINNQYFTLKKSEETHNALFEVILAGKGISGVCQILSQLVGNPVLIVDRACNLLSYSIPLSDQEGYAESWVKNFLENLKEQQKNLATLTSHRCHHFTLSSEQDHNLFVVPVEVNTAKASYLVIIKSLRELDNQDLIVLESASTIVALELVKDKAIFEAEMQIRGELLEDLINNNYDDDENVIRRATYLNFNLASRMTVFYVEIDDYENNLLWENDIGNKLIYGYNDDLIKIAHETFLDFPGGALFMSKIGSITGLVNTDSDKQLMLLNKKLSSLKVKMVNRFSNKFTISVGVGRPFEDMHRVRQSYEEAITAVKIGRFMRGVSSLTFFEELGSYCLLYELRNSSTAFQFYNNTLGKIVKYDRENNTELLKTLIHFFRSDGNLRLTAQSLYIHKNTVIYRLKKVEQLTGLKMSSPEDKFNLQLSVKLHRIMVKQPKINF